MGKVAERLELEECVERFLPAGAALGTGGLHFHNTPMALVRETIRRRVELGLLVPSIDGSIEADQLIGAGLVPEVRIAYVGLELYGMAPRFRAAAEAGRLRVRECEEAGFALGLAAAAAGQPFLALPGAVLPERGSVPTIATVNPGDYRRIEDPFTGAPCTAVRPIAPDVAFVHCQLIDERGNCGFLGAQFLDIELAKAARTCVVQAEREVEWLPASCTASLPGYAVDAYCVVPGGAHPTSSHGLYSHDEEHIVRYARQAATAEGFEAYLRETIGDSEADYRRASRVTERLVELEAGAVS